jgi:hypothetical protein
MLATVLDEWSYVYLTAKFLTHIKKSSCCPPHFEERLKQLEVSSMHIYIMWRDPSAPSKINYKHLGNTLQLHIKSLNCQALQQMFRIAGTKKM